MKWNTDTIVNDLKELLKDDNVKIITEEYPQGEHYCRDIFVYKNTDDVDDDNDAISIIGFSDGDDLSDVDTPDEDIELVEVRNFHSDSDGGLQTRDKQLRNIYHTICDCFDDNNCHVVRNLRDYF